MHWSYCSLILSPRYHIVAAITLKDMVWNYLHKNYNKLNGMHHYWELLQLMLCLPFFIITMNVTWTSLWNSRIKKEPPCWLQGIQTEHYIAPGGMHPNILAPTVNLEINTIQNYDTGCLSLIPFISEQHHETIKQSDNHEHHSLEALKLM